VWTGDIWKLASCLAELRPDLLLIPLDTAPTGLLLVAGLDPDNRVLWNRYNPIVRRFSAEQAPPASVLQRTGVLAADDPRVGRVLAALRNGRETGANKARVAAALRAALAGDGRA
jgi:putative intracellular protease/amidase